MKCPEWFNMKLSYKTMSTKEFIEFYDEYCKQHNIKHRTNEARIIYWAMFYCWKEEREWKII